MQRTKLFDLKKQHAYILTSFAALQHHTTAKVNNMYENMLKDVQESFRPMMDMVEINRKAAEKMFALQTEYMNNLLNTTLSQVQELTVATDPQQLLNLQVQFVQRVENQFSEIAEKELATINEASGELSEIVKTNLDNIAQSELQYMDEVGKLLTMTGLPDFTAASTAPAASPTTAQPASARTATPAKKAAPRTAAKKAAAKPAAKKTVAKKAAPKSTTKTTAAAARQSAAMTTATKASTTATQPVVKTATKQTNQPAESAKTSPASSAVTTRAAAPKANAPVQADSKA